MGKGLLEVLAENNISLQKRSGGRWVAHCPFHEGDRSPSFTVYPNMTYFCFGCRAWGDAVKFLVDYKNMPVYMAMEYVGEEFRKRFDKKTIKIGNSTAAWSLLYQAAEEYHKFLRQTPGAVSYLHYRGLTDKTINKYRIGFSDGAVLTLSSVEDYKIATDVGLINEDGYEMLSHRITIPNIIQSMKACDFIIGRTVTKEKMKYLGLRIPKPIYGLMDVADSPIVFIAEGQFDWLMLRQWGYPSIVIGGTHIQSYNLVALRSKKVVIVPDNDAVGLKAAIDITNKLTNSMILDYKSLDVKDIAELGTRENGMEMFDEIVKEQVSWISGMSPTIQTKWFQRLSM
jgi:DNA primase